MLIVPKIAAECVCASSVPALFKEAGVQYYNVSQVNWPAEFPYAPKMKFAIAHNASSILLHYVVKEDVTGAAAASDCGNVWEDSCCEFFFQPEGAEGYFNIECSCIGKLVFAFGPDRHDRKPVSSAVFAGVGRYASLGNEPFAEKQVPQWETALVIPASSFGKALTGGLCGLKARANFYKCGDALSKPHFLSWAPIATPNPDFHRPEFFDDIRFAE